MIDKLKDRFEDENALVVLLDSWLLCVKMSNFFEIGDGVDIFRDDQTLAIDTSKQIVNMVEDVAAIFILPDKYPLVQKYIYDYALKKPYSGEFNDLKSSSLRLDSKSIKKLSKILKLPLLPVKTTKKGKKSNNSFRTSASRFVDILEDIPQEIRWEIELILLTLDKNQSVYSALSSLERLTVSSEELTNIANNLPDDLRLNIEVLMKSVDENRSTKSILESLNTISEQTRVISETISSLPENIDSSFNETRRLIDHITWRVGEILILLFILGVLITVVIMLCRKKGK